MVLSGYIISFPSIMGRWYNQYLRQKYFSVAIIYFSDYMSFYHYKNTGQFLYFVSGIQYKLFLNLFLRIRSYFVERASKPRLHSIYKLFIVWHIYMMSSIILNALRNSQNKSNDNFEWWTEYIYQIFEHTYQIFSFVRFAICIP